jgi:hypothetical protein
LGIVGIGLRDFVRERIESVGTGLWQHSQKAALRLVPALALEPAPASPRDTEPEGPLACSGPGPTQQLIGRRHSCRRLRSFRIPGGNSGFNTDNPAISQRLNTTPARQERA